MMNNNDLLHQTYFLLVFTCWVVAQRIKSSIDQINMEFKN